MTQLTRHGRGVGPHRVWTEPNDRRVRVYVADEAVADSTRAIYLSETGHLPVYYFPRSDIRFDLLEPSDHHTHCPYKGEASSWSVDTGGTQLDDVVWSYPAPIPEASKIESLLAFYNKRADILVDGVLQERPATKWS